MSQPQRSGSQHAEPFLCPSAAGAILTQNPRAATLILMVGLPAAGKTTRARELAATHQALRLTPDHWMIPLFGDPMADGKRWVLEGRLISVALQALRLGTSVVLDYGLWGRDERSALRWLARSAGAACQVVYLPVDKNAVRSLWRRAVVQRVVPGHAVRLSSLLTGTFRCHVSRTRNPAGPLDHTRMRGWDWSRRVMH